MTNNTKAMLAVGAIVVVFAFAASANASTQKPGPLPGPGGTGGAGAVRSPDGREWTPVGRAQVRAALLQMNVAPDVSQGLDGLLSGSLPTAIAWKLVPGGTPSMNAAQEVTLALSMGSTVYTDPLLTTLLFTTDTALAQSLGWPVLLARPGDPAPF